MAVSNMTTPVNAAWEPAQKTNKKSALCNNGHWEHTDSITQSLRRREERGEQDRKWAEQGGNRSHY